MTNKEAQQTGDIQEKMRGKTRRNADIMRLIQRHNDLGERDTEIRRLNALTVLLDLQLTDAVARLKEKNDG